ncbi:MAG: hypothetical protein NC820_06960 [Candidatus Omnitrophica bacterium]|nr:hypothetical protein [Candidatus Omnitrophota bacterium]
MEINLLNIYILAGLVVFLVCWLLLIISKNNSLEEKIRVLNRDIEELEHQAKLIIKSDIKMRFYQEDMEDKRKKLIMLKSILATFINILDEKKLFSKLDEEIINGIGFKKGLIFNYPNIDILSNINFSSSEIIAFSEIVKKKIDILNSLDSVSPLTSSYLKNDEEIKVIIEKEGIKDFLLCPINVGSRLYAIFLVSECILPLGITSLEEEVLSIICMYIGQCLDNIKLLEALYYAGEEVESKIKEKTFQLSRSLKEIE